MPNNVFKYIAPYEDGNPDELYKAKFTSVFEIETSWGEEDVAYIAEDAAEDYHDNHDGWEAEWPKTFYIYTEAGKHLGTFEVECESRPEFSATEK